MCVVVFGTPVAEPRHTHRVLRCPVCSRPNHAGPFTMVPPTAGPRILSIDGGGVRGAIPLTLLSLLEDRFADMGCGARDFFDLMCGTSSGKQTLTNWRTVR